MKLSLKITLLIFILALIFSLSLIGLNHFILRKDLKESQLEWVNTVVYAVAEGVAMDVINGDVLQAQNKLKKIIREDMALEYAFITDFDGMLFAHTFENGFPEDLISHIQEYKSEDYSSTHFVFGDREIEDIDVSLIKGMRAQLHLGINQKRVISIIERLERDVLGVVICVVLIGALIAGFIGRRISEPLVDLSKWMKSYGKGGRLNNLSMKSSDPDIANVVNSFNAMIRDRSLMEEELHESEAYNRMLFETLPIGLALTRINGVIVDVNPAYSHIVGRDIDELKRISYWDLTPEEYARDEEKQLESLKANGVYGPYEKEYFHADGHRVPVRLQGRIVSRHGEDYIWSSVENIYEEKQAKTELMKSKQELEDQVKQRTAEYLYAKEEAERSSTAKSDFLSHMSHELRTPMNAILGFGQLLQLDNENLNETQRDNVKEIMGAADHLLSLINDVLDLSRIESGKLEVTMSKVVVDDVIKQAMALIQNQLEQRQIELFDYVSGTGYRVYADAIRFKQVLLNLLSNAVKYNCEKGRITLDAKIIDDQRLRISVVDTGAGLTEQEIAKLFNAFERLDSRSQTEGTGIGLVITKHLLELMDGQIGVESKPGVGTTFWMELALVK